MNWLSEHWPWLSAFLAVLMKLAQDHLMIRQHEEKLDDVEDMLDEQRMLSAERESDIKHILHTVDAIAKQQGINQEDIKDILRENNG